MEAEEAVLDLVLLRGYRRVVTDRDL